MTSKIFLLVLSGVSILVTGGWMLSTYRSGTMSIIIDRFSKDPLKETEVRLRGPLAATDPDLVSVIRNKFLKAPSKFPYNLTSLIDDEYHFHKFAHASYVLINSILDDLYFIDDITYRGKERFFVEAGGLDGEFLSNTLRLEREMSWNGLIVEPNSRNFKLIQQKHRKAWISPVCLSKHEYPYMAVIKEKNYDNNEMQSRNSAIQTDLSEDITGYEIYESVQCLPSQSLLLALNVTHIDFFSLDTEGGEFDMLKNFPWETVTVDLWAIEHIRWKEWERLRGRIDYIESNMTLTEKLKAPNISKKEIYDTLTLLSIIEDIDIITFMQSKGYYYFDVLCYSISDFIFIRKGSDLFKKLKVPMHALNRTSICKDKIVLTATHKYLRPEKKFRDSHHFPGIEYKEL